MPTLAESFSQTIARYIPSREYGDKQEYARHKPAPGQKSLWAEDKHPRGQPDNAGEFASAGSTPQAKQAPAKPASPQAAPAKPPAAPQQASPPDPKAVAVADWKANGVRSKPFKAWFGDWEGDAANASKVVNAEGEPQETHDIPGTGSVVKGKDGKPITAYHGTSKGGWTAFDKSYMGKATASGDAESLLYGPGFYFTEDQSVAEEYSKINPKDVYSTDAPRDQLTALATETLQKLAEEYAEWVKADMAADANHYRFAIEHTNGLLKLLAIPQVDFEHNQDALRGLKSYADMAELDSTPIKKGTTAEVKSVYLNIRKPFDIEKGLVDTGDGQKIAALMTSGRWQEIGRKSQLQSPIATTANFIAKGGRDLVTANFVYSELTGYFGKAATNEILQQAGYDGICHIGGSRMGKKEHQVWIAFDPAQIKATDNAGTFDPTNEDIRYHRDGLRERFAREIEAYARKKSAPGQVSMFGGEHDVRDEPRDAGGKWTAGGNQAGTGEFNKVAKQAASTEGQQGLFDATPEQPVAKAAEEKAAPAGKPKQLTLLHGLNDAPGQQDLWDMDKADEPAKPAAAKEAEKQADEVIGKGSTGNVTKRGDRVFKQAHGDEGKVYKALAGVQGIADGKQEGGEISTPHFPYVISRDTVDPKSRHNMHALVQRNAARLANAITALSEAGYAYNDPLQVGLDANKQAHLFDFSNASKDGEEEATRSNLNDLGNFYHEFGLPRYAAAVGAISGTLLYINNDSARKFVEGDETELDAVAAESFIKGLDGKQPKYAYFSFNARTIPGVAQVWHKGANAMLVMSAEPLPQSLIDGYEMVPVLHRSDAAKPADPKPLPQVTRTPPNPREPSPAAKAPAAREPGDPQRALFESRKAPTLFVRDRSLVERFSRALAAATLAGRFAAEVEQYAKKVKSAAGQKSLWGDEPAQGADKGTIPGDPHPHAPEGGITIAGDKFTGGEFIPKESVAKATPAQKEAIKEDNVAPPADSPKISDSPIDSKSENVRLPSSGDGEMPKQELEGKPMQTTNEKLAGLDDVLADFRSRNVPEMDQWEAAAERLRAAPSEFFDSPEAKDKAVKRLLRGVKEGWLLKAEPDAPPKPEPKTEKPETKGKPVAKVKSTKPAAAERKVAFVKTLDDMGIKATDAQSTAGGTLLVLRGNTKPYREIIKKHGGRFFSENRTGGDDPRWLVEGPRKQLQLLEALAGDPENAKAVAEATAKKDAAEAEARKAQEAERKTRNTQQANEKSRRAAGGFGVKIPYDAADIRDWVKDQGAMWDADNKRWLMPDNNLAWEARAKVAQYEEKNLSKPSQPPPKRMSEPKDGERVFTRDTEMRSGAYRVGQRVRDRDGKLWVVTSVQPSERFEDGLSMGLRVDDGYTHTAFARPATEAEAAETDKATKIDALRKQVSYVSHELSDPAGRVPPEWEAAKKQELEQVLTDLAILEGKPTPAQEREQNKAEAKERLSDAVESLATPRETREFGDWWPIAMSLHSSVENVKMLSDEELREQLAKRVGETP